MALRSSLSKRSQTWHEIAAEKPGVRHDVNSDGTDQTILLTTDMSKTSQCLSRYMSTTAIHSGKAESLAWRTELQGSAPGVD